MYCIVPLAGPDLYLEEQKVFKPMLSYRQGNLLSEVLKNRSWYAKVKTFIFILLEQPGISQLKGWLASEFTEAEIVTLSSLTQGALFSSLAGVSLIKRMNEPVIFDLADIDFVSDIDPIQIFQNERAGGIVPYFHSNLPKFSYLIQDPLTELVVSTVEKEVVSDMASAGVYMFRDIRMFLVAALDSIKYREAYQYKGILYLCPAMNGLIKSGEHVVGRKVDSVVWEFS